MVAVVAVVFALVVARVALLIVVVGPDVLVTVNVLDVVLVVDVVVITDVAVDALDVLIGFPWQSPRRPLLFCEHMAHVVSEALYAS